MHSAASEQETSSWLVSDGLKELELLLRAVLSHQSEPILIADDERCCLDASSGAAKLLGLSDAPDHRPANSTILWSQTSSHYITKMRRVTRASCFGPQRQLQRKDRRPVTARITRSFSSNPEGRIVAWYSGAERIYGYKSEEIIGQFESCLYLDDDELRSRLS